MNKLNYAPHLVIHCSYWTALIF